jgi:trans-aconitate 2-methyltransferase
MTDSWDPLQYERFREERQQPFYDLLKLVLPKRGMRILDLGCGTGDLTREMHRHFKASATVGIDSSDAMLEKTGALGDKGLSFRKGTIEGLADHASWDLMLSNAALHWVGDHPAVLSKLTEALAPGGQLAIQMPANQDHPTHVVADELARDAPFAAALGGIGVRQHVLPLERYAVLLHGLGYRKHSVHLQVYAHVMPSRSSVIDWVKGAMLTDLRKRLSEELYLEFLVRYAERLLPLLADEQPYLYTFKRAFLWGEKP